MPRTSLKWILLLVVVAGTAFLGYRYWKQRQSALPEGIFWGNGRIEAKLVDIVSKEPLRIKEILVDEGDVVQPGQVVVRMDTITLDAQLAQAKAEVAAAQEHEAASQAAIVRQKSEVELAKIEAERARKLLEERAGSQQTYDARRTALETSTADLAEDEAKLRTAKEQVEAARANVAVIQSRIDDAILKSPVRGRVLYRLAEVGEVLNSGGKALTLLNLQDIYMEIFLPSEQAGRVKIGNDARITVDFAPDRAAPGYVSFVSPQAQFTPKQVETRSERDKLMFRVKIQVPPQLVLPYIDLVKTGIRGVGYVKADRSAVWPARLQHLAGPPEPPGSKPASQPVDFKPETRTETEKGSASGN